MENAEIVNKLSETFNKLSKIEDIGYQIHITKVFGENKVFVSSCITVNYTKEISDNYMYIIHKCHNELKKLGYNEVTLLSCSEFAQLNGSIQFNYF